MLQFSCNKLIMSRRTFSARSQGRNTRSGGPHAVPIPTRVCRCGFVLGRCVTVTHECSKISVADIRWAGSFISILLSRSLASALIGVHSLQRDRAEFPRPRARQQQWMCSAGCRIARSGMRTDWMRGAGTEKIRETRRGCEASEMRETREEATEMRETRGEGGGAADARRREVVLLLHDLLEQLAHVVVEERREPTQLQPHESTQGATCQSQAPRGWFSAPLLELESLVGSRHNPRRQIGQEIRRHRR